MDKKLKHTIEVVVDRIVVGGDIKTRLADSFETALRLTDGIAIVEFFDDKKVLTQKKLRQNRLFFLKNLRVQYQALRLLKLNPVSFHSMPHKGRVLPVMVWAHGRLLMPIWLFPTKNYPLRAVQSTHGQNHHHRSICKHLMRLPNIIMYQCWMRGVIYLKLSVK